MALVEPLTRIFQELIPEVTVNHIADSSLIKEVIANNQVTPAVRRRLLSTHAPAWAMSLTMATSMPASPCFVLTSRWLPRLC